MKDVRAHIRTLVERLQETFDGIGVRYEFKESAGVHFIEVTPQAIFESKGFAEFQHAALEKFYDDFPHTSLAFITSDSLVKIANPEIAASPKVHDEVKFVAFGRSLGPNYTTVNAPIGYLTVEDLTIQQEARVLYCLPSSGIFEIQISRVPIDQGFGRLRITTEENNGVLVTPLVHIDGSQLNWTMLFDGLPLVAARGKVSFLERFLKRSEEKTMGSRDMESSHNYALAS